MVKNLPTVERSTKIRFGKNCLEDQAENTIVFNASNEELTASHSNTVYLSPIRNRTDYGDKQIVLLMYNRATKEITESGEAATDIIQTSLQGATNFGNITSNLVTFTGAALNAGGKSFVTSNIVGLSNLFPQHTVSVGSNLYIDDTGSNVLVISGNVSVLKDITVEGNLTVCGTTTTLITENTSIRDAIVELGRNNTSTDDTIDLGLLLNRPINSNVMIGFVEDNDEITLAYTHDTPTSKTLTPLSSEHVNVHVYGRLYTEANVGIKNTATIHTLDVGSNLYVDDLASNVLFVNGNTDLEGNVTVSKNAYITGNVNISNQLIVSDNAYVTGNVQVTEALIVSGNTHLEGDNVFITNTMDFLDPTTAIVTDQVSNVQIRLGQLENVSNLASNPIENEVLMYDGNQWMNTFPNHSFLTIKNDEPTATLVSGNAVYISGYQNENLAKVKLAKSDSPTTMPAIGVVYGDDIAPAAEGLAVAYGKVNQMNTNGYQVGQTLYVSNVYAGYLTTVKPCDDQDANPDLIQNVGVVTRQNPTHGAIFVTGIGRANDIPNAELITNYNNMQYVYVNNTNNDLKKITSANLNIPLTTAVSSSSNSAANAVTLRGLSITSGDGFHGDIVAAGNVTVDTNTFKVDAEANRVGLGTTNPTQTLDVRGSISTDDYLIHNGDTNTKIGFSGDDTFVVNTNGNEQVKVGADGNVYITSNLIVDTSTLFVHSENNRVGVGKTNPTYPLDVAGSISTDDFLIHNGNTNTKIGFSSDDTFVVNTNGTEQLKIDKTGNVYVTSNLVVNTNDLFVDAKTQRVGIGTTLPTYPLDVTGSISTDDYLIHNGDDNTKIGFSTDDTFVVNTNGTEQLKIDPSGNVYVTSNLVVNTNDLFVDAKTQRVGIGSTLPSQSLDVNGGARISSLSQTYFPFVQPTTKKLVDSQMYQNGDDVIVLNTDVQVTGTLLVQGESFEVSSGELIIQDRIIDIANNNTDHTSDIGILMEHPGYNIGIIHHGNHPHTLSLGYTLSGYADEHINRDVGNVITVDVWGNVTTQNSLVVHENIHILDGGLGINVGDASDTNTLGGKKLYVDGDVQIGNPSILYVDDSEHGVGIATVSPTSNLHIVGNAFVTSNITTSSNVLINGDAAASSKTTGALQVTGGVGIQGDVYATNGNLSGQLTAGTGVINGNLTVNTNDLKVDTSTRWVGVGVATPTSKLHVSGNTFVTSNITTSSNVLINGDCVASSKKTGALQVVGGVGIQGKIYTGDAVLDSATISGDLIVNTNDLKVDTSTNWVGVGIATPTSKLHVSGNTFVTSNITTSSNVLINGDCVATSKTTGALQVVGGAGIQGDIYAADATFDNLSVAADTDVVGIIGIAKVGYIGHSDYAGFAHYDHATSTNYAFLQASTGQTYINTVTNKKILFRENNVDKMVLLSGNLGINETSPATKLHVAGGTIMNSDAVAKKTYSYTSTIAGGTTIANATITINFTARIFSARIIAHLIESDDEMSTMSIECCGGHRTGGTPLSIVTGPVSIFGNTSTNPWDPTITTTGTSLSIKPSTDIDSGIPSANYNIFIEYLSADTNGKVSGIDVGGSSATTFNY